MNNENAQILVGATAVVGSLEVMLCLKNLYAAYSMKNAPTDYLGLQEEDFESLRRETILRCKYEVAGVVLNCGVLVTKIWLGYYPKVWEMIIELLGKPTFIKYWVFQLADILANTFIFAPIVIQIRKCRGTPGVKIKSMSKGHLITIMPLGIIGLLVMIFAEDLDPRIWFFLPFVAIIDEILLGTVKQYRFKELIDSDPDLAITKQVKDVAELFDFPSKHIYKDPDEKEVPEANYHQLGHVIVVSEKLLSLPEKTAVILISLEIGIYTKRKSLMNFVMPLVRCVGLGFLLVKSIDSDEVSEVFGFSNSPYPYVPMYLAYAYVWPVFSIIMYRIECLFYSRYTLGADSVIHKVTSNQGKDALNSVAGRAEKYPIFDTWYSQLMRGYPTVAQRIKNLESQD